LRIFENFIEIPQKLCDNKKHISEGLTMSMTENSINTDTLRDRLLVAGTNELGLHGIADFSLRRVAAACQTSCAAPYKHFRNKEEFILEIIRYINRQWELLRDQILTLFEGDGRKQLIEVCIAYIRFWIANPNYRSALTASEKTIDEKQSGERAKNSADVGELLQSYYTAAGMDSKEAARKLCTVKAILYGMTAMLENGELPNDAGTFDMIRGVIEKEIA